MQFQWQTDDERGWDEQAPATRQPTRRLRPRPILVLVAIALGLGIVAVVNQVGDRVDARAIEIETNVAATSSLVHAAASQQDLELFLSLLSGREPEWTEVQKAMLQTGGLLDRAGLGLRPAPGATFDITGVRVAPDFLAAVVTGTVRYVGPLAAEVTLVREEVYRLGPDRWLLSPPDDTAWGPTVTSRGSHLDLSYPVRDERIASRLAFDLDRLVARVCAELAALASCDGALPVRLALSPDAGSLVGLAGESSLKTGIPVTMPAPRLVGVPTDEAGYEALLWGYGRQLVAGLVGELAGAPCCEAMLFARLLLERTLADVGLGEWAIDAGTSRELYARQSGLIDAVRRGDVLWSASASSRLGETDETQARLLVEFIVAHPPGWQPFSLWMLANESDGFRDWLRVVLPDYPDRRASEPQGAWKAFLFAAGRWEQPMPPIPLPAALRVICNELGDQAVFRYDLASGQAAREVGPLEIQGALAAPGGRDLLMVGQDATLLRWDGRFLQHLYEARGASGLFAIDLDPRDRLLPLIAITDGASVPLTFFVLDLETCGEGSCRAWQLEGLPIWSPDGERSILLDFVEGNVKLGDAQGQALWALETGQLNLFAATWLDDRRVVLPALGDDGRGPALHIVDVISGESEMLLAADTLHAMLPEEARAGTTYVQHLAASHEAPATLLIATATTWTTSWMSVFLLDVETGMLRRVLSDEGSYTGFPPVTTVEPGRWSAVPLWFARSDEGVVYLVDAWAGGARSWNVVGGTGGPAIAWSADGRWLAIADGFGWRLVAPDHGYERLVVPGLENCDFVQIIG